MLDDRGLDGTGLDGTDLDGTGRRDGGAVDGAPAADPPQRSFADEAAAAALAPLIAAGPYLPWGAGTLRVAGLVAVCNDIVLSSRRRIVELGSGTSTVLLARLLRQHCPDGDYRHVAVEHDAAWADWVAGQLEREGLHGGTTVVHAPLAPHPHAVCGLAWYDGAVLDRGLDVTLGGDPVDLLLVDGPPADTADKVLARYPALPALAGRLAPGASVVLDDVERPGEQEVVRRWAQEHGVHLQTWSPTAGLASGRTPGAGRQATPEHG